MGSTPEPERRLDSWKQIAGYLNKSERTVRRWHESEGLPVHKHPHQHRGSVWAFSRELDDWLSSRVVRPDPPVTTTPTGGIKIRWEYATLVVIGAILAAGWMILRHIRLQSPAVHETIPLTALPGSEYGASFSPDGMGFVFRWDPVDATPRGLYVKNMGSERPRPLVTRSGGPEIYDYSAAWAPDGKTIAFLRRTGDMSTWLVTVDPDGRNERRLTQLAAAPTIFFGNHQHVSWSRDSQWIYAPIALPDTERGICRVSKATGAISVLTRGIPEYAPAVSPDGAFLACLHMEGLPLSAEELLLYRLKKDGTVAGSPVSLYKGHSMSSGLSWMDNSKTLLLCKADTSFLGGLDSQIFEVPIAEGRAKFPLGGSGCNTLSVSPQGAIVFGQATRRSRMMKANLLAKETPQEFVPSSRYDSVPSFSPDGKRVAFYSTRSGQPEIWVAQKDGGSLRRITENSRLESVPAWSPDGLRMLYVSGGSLVVTLADGADKPAPIVTGSAGVQNPVWSADGQAIYYTIGSQLWGVRADSGKPANMGTMPQTLSLAESPSDKSLYYTRFGRKFALCRFAANGASELIQDGLALPQIAVTKRFIYYVGEHMNLYRLPVSGGEAHKIHTIPAFDTEGINLWETRFAISPDDSTIVWIHAAPHELDLEMLR